MVLKPSLIFIVFLGGIQLSYQNRCYLSHIETKVEWPSMPKKCNLSSPEPSYDSFNDIRGQRPRECPCHSLLEGQITHEIKASLTYLAMSTHFLNANNYRPGAAQFFLKSAIEERTHAKKIIEYLLLRGAEVTNANSIPSNYVDQTSWDNLKLAFEAALTLEKTVTENIKKIIQICGGEDRDQQVVNDYHTVDYLTGDFLKEQHEGEREIAGHISILTRLGQIHGTFSELIFDKGLLK